MLEKEQNQKDSRIPTWITILFIIISVILSFNTLYLNGIIENYEKNYVLPECDLYEKTICIPKDYSYISYDQGEQTVFTISKNESVFVCDTKTHYHQCTPR